MKFIKRPSSKPLIAMIAGILITFSTVGGTVAWLFANSDSKVNRFTPATVEGEIVEDFKNGVKKNVQVRNDSDVAVYVRVALVPTWQDREGNILAESAGLENLNFMLKDGWFQGNDGFYYHREQVAPGQATRVLAEPISVRSGAPSGAQMNLQILSEIIQANPADAVQQAWKVSVNSDGRISLS